MLDYFALIEERRRPWLDSELLKQKFLTLSAAQHPDRAHDLSKSEQSAAGARFADLNAAYQCLREPKDRLSHLLELEMGARPKDARDVPPDAVDLFFEVGRVCREADQLLAAKAKAASALAKAQMFGAALELTEKLNQLQDRLRARYTAQIEELKHMNAAWEGATALPLDELERVQRMFSYLARWSGQIQERVVQLSF